MGPHLTTSRRAHRQSRTTGLRLPTDNAKAPFTATGPESPGATFPTAMENGRPFETWHRRLTAQNACDTIHDVLTSEPDAEGLIELARAGGLQDRSRPQE